MLTIYKRLLEQFFLPNIFYHTTYLDPLFSGANVARNSQIRPSTMLFLSTVKLSKILRAVQCRNIRIKFSHYWPTGSNS
jgi:hypothetical protein